uniref:Large ribosomal subunit protein mL38 n=1 Tax=Phallusia mammillata TaxID=59560 RepID=A0A6F9DKK0_9ASCI|nr:39S ribosomal protein L38, mitochondrial-like [Phallusia mammillata]
MSFARDVSLLSEGFGQIWRLHYRYYASGYRISPETLVRKECLENMTDEAKFNEKVTRSMLHKRPSKLRVFEKASVNDILGKKKLPLPNEKYFNTPNIPQYGSYDKYVKHAELVRKEQRESDTHWKTIDKWQKIQNDEPNYTDVGFKLIIPKLTLKEKKECRKVILHLKNNLQKQKDAQKRHKTFCVDTAMEEWERDSQGIKEICTIAKHYNIYRDLFCDKIFYPVVHMDVEYEATDYVSPVYYGNSLSPSAAASPPNIMFDSNPDSLWTLILVNPDGNLESTTSEYVHWFIGNIKGNEVASGDVVVDYLQPLPMRGTGYHRMIFVLYKQKEKINYDKWQKDSPCLLLRDRWFQTKDFFDEFQSQLTPASIRFFQSKWDESVLETFHNKLNMAEPVYEFVPQEYEKLGVLKPYPHRKTLTWLKKFMPSEPLYPGGGTLT